MDVKKAKINKETFKKTLATIVLAGALGCGLASKVEATSTTDSNSIIQDGIEYYMQTDKSVYSLGQDVEILYRVTNLDGNSVDLAEVINCWFWGHLIITDIDDTEIWEYHRVVPPCGYIMLHLEPYESKECQKTWEMTNDNGTFERDDDFPIGPGVYNIMGELEAPGGRVPVSVSINVVEYVNFKHYAILANDWMKTGPAFEGDINRDRVVDYNDLKIMAGRWLYKILEDDTEDSFSCAGGFDPCYPCSNAVDEDWDTYALPPNPYDISYIYENYIIPSGTLTADFRIKYEQNAAVTPGLCTNVTDYWNGSTWTELNCTALTNQISTLTVEIPDDALSPSILQLRTRTWKSSGIPGGGDGKYYEGKVIWYSGD